MEGSFGGTKPDMRSLTEVGGLVARFEQYEAENRVEQWERLNVLVQEKLDGLGVSIFFKEQHQPVLNYRPSPHPADKEEDEADFRDFQEWVYAHEEDLFRVLGSDRSFVLHGQWLAGRQRGVHYSRLPSPFVAVDLMEAAMAHRFLAYDLMVEVLGSVVPAAPVLWRSRPAAPYAQPIATTPGAHFNGLQQRIKLPQALTQTSAFGDEPVEGLYLRIERGGETTHHRYKLMRQTERPDDRRRGPKTNVVVAS